MIGRTLFSLRASARRWSQESRRLVGNDPAASYCVSFSELRQKLADDGLFGSNKALAADCGGNRTLTYSTQAATILTPTAHVAKHDLFLSQATPITLSDNRAKRGAR